MATVEDHLVVDGNGNGHVTLPSTAELHRTKRQLNALLQEISRHKQDKRIEDRYDRRLWLRAGRIALGPED